LDNENGKASDEMSVEHVTTSDVSAVERVFEDIGFVMCANKNSRLVNIIFYYIMLLLKNISYDHSTCSCIY